MNYFQQQNKLTEIAKDLSHFDSKVFFEISNGNIGNYSEYRTWLTEMEKKWITTFNKGTDYHFTDRWNTESRIVGQFGEFYLEAKFYRYDGTIKTFSADDWRAKRGVLIRDHYSPIDTAKVHVIAKNLEDFLTHENVQYSRTNFLRKG